MNATNRIVFNIDSLLIQFGACQNWKSLTIEVLLNFLLL